jgi:glycosyltransferase involved in cell wall biosynthesis
MRLFGAFMLMPKTLVIQIPCYNEAQTLGETITDLPRSLPGISRVAILVVDDGSTDDTAQVALMSGADYVVRHRQKRGLAQAFMTGLSTALALDADIVVNTDADHQYPGRYVVDLVAPILSGTADFVVGDRQPGQNIHFSPLKRLLENLGSFVIRVLSKTDARDAPSGFRAYSRYAALRLQVHSSYSYTLETMIQAGRERMAIVHVPIQTNPALRPSRLHGGMLDFIWQQSGAIIRSYVLYQPLASFFLIGIPFLVAGAILIARFLYLYATGNSGIGRYVQSVSIGGTLALFGLLLMGMGLLGDALRANRQMMQDILSRLRDQTSLSKARRNNEVDGSPLIRKEGGGRD